LNSYSCALKNVILLQGFLFVSTEALYFFSFIDDSNVGSFFSFSASSITKMRIKYSEIEQIYKSKNNIIGFLDNSIRIELKSDANNELFITSFLDRNGAFDLIIKQI